VTILTWVEGLYEETVFQTTQKLVSAQFGELNLTAEQTLKAGL
jgi:hypothetical protein